MGYDGIGLGSLFPHYYPYLYGVYMDNLPFFFCHQERGLKEGKSHENILNVDES